MRIPISHIIVINNFVVVKTNYLRSLFVHPKNNANEGKKNLLCKKSLIIFKRKQNIINLQEIELNYNGTSIGNLYGIFDLGFYIFN